MLRGARPPGAKWQGQRGGAGGWELSISLLHPELPAPLLPEILFAFSELPTACLLFVHPRKAEPKYLHVLTSKALSLGTAPKVCDSSLPCKVINPVLVAREGQRLLPLPSFLESLLEVQLIPRCPRTKHGQMYGNKEWESRMHFYTR